MPTELLHNENALLEQVAQGDESAFRVVFDHNTVSGFWFMVSGSQIVQRVKYQPSFMVDM